MALDIKSISENFSPFEDVEACLINKKPLKATFTFTLQGKAQMGFQLTKVQNTLRLVSDWTQQNFW